MSTSTPSPFTLTIGTRRSGLALKQVDLIIASLQPHHPHITFAVDAVATMGDVDKTTPLPNLGKGLWTNELEAKLLTNQVDFVVHCLKDMPTTLPAGCVLGAITEREDPRDVVVFPKGGSSKAGRYARVADLPEGAVVGTSSVRRAAQLKRKYPGLRFADIRGNIDTRMKKVDAEGAVYDCTILAAAGLHRMGQHDRIAQYLDSSEEGGEMLYAVGQGALGLECREGDERVLEVLRCIDHRPTNLAGAAERSIMRTLEGGCSVPIGVETTWVGGPGEDKLRLKATVVSLDGKQGVDGEMTATIRSVEEAEALGEKLAAELVEKGAQKILDVINSARDTTAPGVGASAAVKISNLIN
ncbi:porphobilinogen deaminase-like protein [Coniochaeta ligniaria NRRL 30616]|uniref:Porphobilinogen deaminase n=1 Tax=Coniochaeta ligniaria NRRL 30616 TaxID=1408157 RepID=A0A1J7JAB4_9PEZI|nr:porphobilinogen deaminase-like protein [Coniochaeta ligniaria NRRL 30616]